MEVDEKPLEEVAPGGRVKSQHVYEPSRVPFHEHLRLARRQRDFEKQRSMPQSGNDIAPLDRAADKENAAETNSAQAADPTYTSARRALRSASWTAVFFLVTTDLLGPANAPFAISQVGYVPGVILYIIMAVAAAYCGLLLWFLFLKMDSEEFPITTYSDVVRRIAGPWAAHTCNILQSIQLIMMVGTLCLYCGQALSQISRGRLCFAVAILIWAFVGMALSQVRTLRNFGALATCSVFINCTLIVMSMGFIAYSQPNYAAAGVAYGIPPGPVMRSAFVNSSLSAKVNGIMNMVVRTSALRFYVHVNVLSNLQFAYGGALMFPELLAEMRRPWDFWKAMTCAQVLVMVMYLLYGLFVYSYQGQFTLPVGYQGVSKYGWQTAGNVLAIISIVIGAGLYGHIGIKVAYYGIVEGIFKGPPLITDQGRYIWSAMVIVYWSLAYVLATGIPQVQTISGFLGALCIMQLTYSFPPLLAFGYCVRRDGTAMDGTFSIAQGLRSKRSWTFKWLNLVLALAALAMAFLGMWGSGVAIADTFRVSRATSFGCVSPV